MGLFPVGNAPAREFQIVKEPKKSRCYQAANGAVIHVSRLGVRASRENGGVEGDLSSGLPLGWTSGYFGVHGNGCHSIERDVDSPGAEPDSGLGESVLPEKSSASCSRSAPAKT